MEEGDILLKTVKGKVRPERAADDFNHNKSFKKEKDIIKKIYGDKIFDVNIVHKKKNGFEWYEVDMPEAKHLIEKCWSGWASDFFDKDDGYSLFVVCEEKEQLEFEF